MIESSCVFCGCGCRLNYSVKNNKIIKVSGVKTDNVSDGVPCIKGLMIHEMQDKNRITKPLIKKNGKFEEVSLAQAINHIYSKTKKVSPNQVFFNTSGKISNENNFVLQKFARTCYKTSNIDSCCGRLCHIATVMGMNNVFGNSNITRMSNIKKIDTLLVFGSEPDKNYPVFYNKMLKKKDLKIINIHSFLKSVNSKNELITLLPGSETCLLNGLVNELIEKGLKSRIEGFNILKQKVKSYTVDFVTKTCNISKKDYLRLIKIINESKKLGVFHGMALTQHVNSIENIHSLLNLVVLKKGQVLSLRGEINVQGVGDLGGSPGILPTGDISTKEKLENSWGKINESKGLNIMEALLFHPVKTIFLTEFDPFKSLPAINEVKKRLKNTFIAYFGSYFNTTSNNANVVIPIASLIESEGSITNGEKRLRKVNKVINNNLELWKILKKFSEKFNQEKKFDYKNSKEIFYEIKKLVPTYSKINVNKLWKGIDQWGDKKIKHVRFMPESFDGLDDSVCKEYPFILTTFRSKYSFLSNEITKNSKTLSKHREPIGFYFNKKDLTKLGLKVKNEIRVTSSAGSLVSKAYLSKRLPKGIIGAYFHYSKLMINTLYPIKFDEESQTPNYKSVSVKVEKL